MAKVDKPIVSEEERKLELREALVVDKKGNVRARPMKRHKK